MTRVAVVGVGQFGRNHARVAASSNRASLVAVVDSNPSRAAEVASQHACRPLHDASELVGCVDAAVVAVPTSAHADLACRLMAAGIDVLVEKPIAPDLESAGRMIAAAQEHRRVLQVGHLERFNPAVIALERHARLPLFFEVHRLSVFSPRSLDVDVVLDLMIHDLDIVMNLATAELEEIRAAGISILSPKEDIANVRLQFRNGCVANLTASRVSTEKVRKLRIFQPREYISVDYSRQDALSIRVDERRQISFHPLPVDKGEPLAAQFEAFLDCVENRSAPKVNGPAARRTLEVALAILDKMKEHAEVVAQSVVTEWQP
jgi:predicted dehydrogenase